MKPKSIRKIWIEFAIDISIFIAISAFVAWLAVWVFPDWLAGRG